MDSASREEGPSLLDEGSCEAVGFGEVDGYRATRIADLSGDPCSDVLGRPIIVPSAPAGRKPVARL